MARTDPEILGRLAQLRQELKALLVQPLAPARMASGIARALLTVFQAQCQFCAWRAGPEEAVALLDEKGNVLEEKPRWLAETLTGRPNARPLEGTVGSFSGPHTLLVQTFSGDAKVAGTIGLVLPKSSATAHLREPDASAILTFCSDWITLGLMNSQHAAASSSAAGAETVSSGLSEVTALVTHELNNHLNGILLQVALLEQTVAASSHAELGVIRRLGQNAAGLIRRLQQYNRQEYPSLRPLDLNDTVRSAVRNAQASGIETSVRLELAPDLPPVSADDNFIERIIQLLLMQASGVSKPAHVEIFTERADGRARIRLGDNGPSVQEDMLARISEPFSSLRGEEPANELAICKLLVRRMRGSFTVQNRAGGGMEFQLELNLSDDPVPTGQPG